MRTYTLRLFSPEISKVFILETAFLHAWSTYLKQKEKSNVSIRKYYSYQYSVHFYVH